MKQYEFGTEKKLIIHAINITISMHVNQSSIFCKMLYINQYLYLLTIQYKSTFVSTNNMISLNRKSNFNLSDQLQDENVIIYT